MTMLSDICIWSLSRTSGRRAVCAYWLIGPGSALGFRCRPGRGHIVAAARLQLVSIKSVRVWVNCVDTFLILFMMLNFCVEMKLSSTMRIAMLTSSSLTYSRRCMRACASDMRIIDSMCRTVIGILPVACTTECMIYLIYDVLNALVNCS